MTIENISRSISMKDCCRPRQGLNPRPPGLQLDGASNWAAEAGNISRAMIIRRLYYTRFVCTILSFFSTVSFTTSLFSIIPSLTVLSLPETREQKYQTTCVMLSWHFWWYCIDPTYWDTLTLILLFTTTPTFANSVDPDQMASEEAIWSGSTLFVIQLVILNENNLWRNLIGW